LKHNNIDSSKYTNELRAGVERTKNTDTKMRVCSSARKELSTTRGRYSVTIRGGLVFITAPRNCKIFGWRSRSSIKSSTWSLALPSITNNSNFQTANQISSSQSKNTPDNRLNMYHLSKVLNE